MPPCLASIALRLNTELGGIKVIQYLNRRPDASAKPSCADSASASAVFIVNVTRHVSHVLQLPLSGLGELVIIQIYGYMLNERSAMTFWG